ncbi:MAG: hypothetical protein GY870_02145 [archaeon]|nr:hypothetical protein [archaeon]
MVDSDPISNKTTDQNSSNPLNKFNMNELIGMLRTFYRIRKKSSDMLWTEGSGLISIESTLEESESILQEVIDRIHEKWTIDRISRNRRQKLPKFLLNSYNISTAELTYILLNNMVEIGSDKWNDDKVENEEIYFIIDDTKYKMKNDGIIESSMDEEAQQKRMKEMFRKRF